MPQTPSEAAVAALRRLGLPILRDELGTLVTPVSLSPSEVLLVRIVPDDRAEEVLVAAELCTVPKARRTHVALLLAELNTKWRFVVFALNQSVWVDISVELAFASDQERLIVLSVIRLLKAINEERPRILQAVQARSRRKLSRAEREVAKILADLPFPHASAPDAEP